MNTIFQIDVNHILATKAPQLACKIPPFLVRLLCKIIHQDDLNVFLRQNGEDQGVDFMLNAVRFFNISIEVKGEENIPADGNFIFSSNHPLGGLDGICLSAFLGTKYDKRIKYLVNDILYFIEPLRSIFVPINKHGFQAKHAAQAINDAFASDNQIITFPAGLCSRKTKGEIKDLEWKKMFVVKAVEYKRDVIPVYFEARNSKFFYRFANFRKRIGLKFNLEMLLLPHEMFKAKNSTFSIHFGKPIPWQTFDDSKSPKEWAEEVKSIVYQKVSVNNG